MTLADWSLLGPFFYLVRRHAKQTAGILVFGHPERAVRRDLAT
jgi:hypothetical protein